MLQKSPQISFVSLGCPKALVDSERIITHLRAEGYGITREHTGADIVIVNTCGFIDSAKSESLEAINDALNENGKVIVTGCMGAQPDEITKHFHNLLSISGPQAYETVISAVHEALPPAHEPFLDLVPPQGIKLTPRHYAYLKISEGCHNRCSFCIIPQLRGDLVSRPIHEVLKEAQRLAQAGVKELLVISQDTSAYGLDIKYNSFPWQGREVRTRFYDLANELGELGIWIRMHYVYPYPHVDHVIPLMAEGKILPYLDMPLQHAAPNVLNAMKRPAHTEKTLERIKNWRSICPDLTLRSTFIVGFPGETDHDFELLLQWLEEAKLDRVGCFKFEAVKGAPANDLPNQVPEDVKEERWHRFMQTQQAISADILESKIGQTLPVIIDAYNKDNPDGAVYIGRSSADAPDIDGLVYVTSEKALNVGDIVHVEISESDDYDLYGEIYEEQE